MPIPNKQTLIDELQVLVGKRRSALVSKVKGGTTQKQRRVNKNKELSEDEQMAILMQLAELE